MLEPFCPFKMTQDFWPSEQIANPLKLHLILVINSGHFCNEEEDGKYSQNIFINFPHIKNRNPESPVRKQHKFVPFC